MRRLSRVLATVVIVTGLCSSALAQEIEPNGSCASAQERGSIEPPALLDGSLDAPEGGEVTTTDVDFFRLSAEPGKSLVIRVSTGQSVGIFDADCTLQAVSSAEGKLAFKVPADGSFTLAVADPFDNSFSGNGSTNSGAYEVSLEEAPGAVASVSGRLVDAVTGEALRGDTQFARVDLLSCDAISCSPLVSGWPDALGRFRFELDAQNEPIPAGALLIVATVDNHKTELEDFNADEGEDVDLGDIALSPPPIAFSDLRPCSGPLPQGGVCQYTVRIRNNTTEELRGQAHSVVINTNNQTLFEASTRRTGTGVQRAAVKIPARSTSDVTFHFTVPSFLPLDTTVCADLFLGLEPSPLFNVVHAEGLFCITKGIFGLRVMGERESRAALQGSSRMAPARAMPRLRAVPRAQQ